MKVDSVSADCKRGLSGLDYWVFIQVFYSLFIRGFSSSGLFSQ